jgi:microcin C transport system substrate-binding protein
MTPETRGMKSVSAPCQSIIARAILEKNSVLKKLWWVLLVLPVPAIAMDKEYRHGHSFVFELKYPPEYQHFDYADPQAPVGGALRLSMTGTFNSFNHFAGRGRPAAGLSDIVPLIYDRLLYTSADEPSARYGQLAEGVAWADDYSWIAFKLREGAYWHDGEPITVDDVIFTFDTLRDHGSVGTKTNLQSVLHVEQIGPREVRFVNDPAGPNNKRIIEHLGRMDILPRHYWQDREPDRTTTVPPLGSGPYIVDDYRLGRYVVYRRNPDYWGWAQPFARGRFNFETVKFDYFRDEHIRRQALRNDQFDLAIERVAKSWTLDYDFAEARAGLFRKELVEMARPAGLWGPIFWNVRREHLQDIRVREALWLLFDFRFMNRVLMYDYYDYANSFFHGSRLAQTGLPSEDELQLLEPFRDQLPARVFSEEFNPPPGDGFGYNRDRVRRALELFADAGWHVQGRQLTHETTGRHFRIEFVTIAQAHVRLLTPFMETMKRIGIDASARAFEQSNYLHRMTNRQFDGGIRGFESSSLPGEELRNQFSSASADVEFGLNWAGIRDPIVDHLIEQIIAADDERALIAATRAFDRVMLWNFYFIPGMANPWVQLVFWDRFGIPESGPLERPVHIETWWFDAERARRVERGSTQPERRAGTAGS